jgi:hypothetical protein
MNVETDKAIVSIGMKDGQSGVYLTSLSTTELIWLEKQYSCLPSVFAVIEVLPWVRLMSLASARWFGSVNCRGM